MSSERSVTFKTGSGLCPYCGVGCVVTAGVSDNTILKISAGKETAPNYGMLCPKGAYLKDIFGEKGRHILKPRCPSCSGQAGDYL